MKYASILLHSLILAHWDVVRSTSDVIAIESMVSSGYISIITYSTDNCVGSMSADIIGYNVCFNSESQNSSTMYSLFESSGGYITSEIYTWTGVDCNGDPNVMKVKVSTVCKKGVYGTYTKDFPVFAGGLQREYFSSVQNCMNGYPSSATFLTTGCVSADAESSTYVVCNDTSATTYTYDGDSCTGSLNYTTSFSTYTCSNDTESSNLITATDISSVTCLSSYEPTGLDGYLTTFTYNDKHCQGAVYAETVSTGFCYNYQNGSGSIIYNYVDIDLYYYGGENIMTSVVTYGEPDCRGAPTMVEQPSLSSICEGGVYSTYSDSYPSSFPDGFELRYFTSTDNCESDVPSGGVFESTGCYATTASSSNYVTCNDTHITVEKYSGAVCSGDINETVSFPTYNCLNNSDAATTENTVISAYCIHSSSDSCFAGSETVQLEGGDTVALSEVRVGDRVLAAAADGRFVFSEVVAVPHGRNTAQALLVLLSLTSGRDLLLTPDHLVMVTPCWPVPTACSATSPWRRSVQQDGGVVGVAAGASSGSSTKDSLVAASEIMVGMCVRTVEGQERVAGNRRVRRGASRLSKSRLGPGDDSCEDSAPGLYTIVTTQPYVVINGIVASPFAGNHVVPHAFYNIHRLFHMWAPGLVPLLWLQRATEVFGRLVSQLS